MLFTNEMSNSVLSKQWVTVKLGDVVTVKIGRTPARNKVEYWQNGEVPWVSIADLNNGRIFSTKERVSQLAFKEVFNGQTILPETILFSFKLTIGKVCILDIPAVHNEAIASLITKSNRIDRDYLFYLLQSLDYSVYLDTYLKGKTLNKDKIIAISLLLPPLPEQRAIAHILQTVQQAIQTRLREVVLERERKAALMQHLFTHGMRNEPTKQSEVGEIPESWEVVRLANAIRIAHGQINPTEELYKTMNHVGPENIEPDTGTLLETRTNEQLNIISGNYYFTDQDILYSKIRPYLNKVALPLFEGTCSADMYPLRPNKDYFTREFLYHLLLSEKIKRQAVAFQDRTGIPKINREQLSLIFLPKPPESEQKKLSMILGTINSKIAALEKEITLHEELFRALLDELMTGRISTLPLVEQLEKGILTHGQRTADGTGTPD